MSTPPTPLPPPKQEFDSASDIFAPIKLAKDIQKFLKTRTAIVSGETLYKDMKSDLSSRGLMGPWVFNITQSTICSIPGMTMAAFAWLLDVHRGALTTTPGDRVTLKILSVLSPLMPPLTLLLIVYVIAFCSLPPGFVTGVNWKAAQRKYLYLDGAFGLWPQFILASCIAVTGATSPPPGSTRAPLIFGVAVWVFIGTFIWQSIITAFKIREGMFEYDYLSEQDSMFGSLKERPIFRFYMLAGLGLPVLTMLLFVGLFTISSLLAAIVHKL
jgi:hypothetical protein